MATLALVADDLSDFTRETFSHDGVSRQVFRLAPAPGSGANGKGRGVVLMHELPGITPEAARLARRLAEAGFNVLMPSLFGAPGQPFTGGYVMKELARVCIVGEFAALASTRSGPVVDWLCALCRAAHAELGGPGVGVIGMCFTGNFAISLMADESVTAPVTSQPSLPFGSMGRRSELHVSPDELVQIRRRAREQGVPLLGLRFTGDALCPAARFQRLRAELGDRFEAVEIDSALFSSKARKHGIRALAHSVLTLDFVDEAGHPTHAALQRVLSFLDERLNR